MTGKSKYYILLWMVIFTFQITNAQNEMTFEKAKKHGNFAKENFVFSKKTYDGRDINSEELKGNVVLYVYGGGASCGPCISLGQTIAKNTEKYRSENIKIIYITNGSFKELDRYKKRKDLKYDDIISISGDEILELGFIRHIFPSYVLVDQAGRVIEKGAGWPLKKEESEIRFKEVLDSAINKLMEK